MTPDAVSIMLGSAAVLVAIGLDIGLIAFLVGPGLLPVTQGLVDPVLIVVALAAVAVPRRGRRPTRSS